MAHKLQAALAMLVFFTPFVAALFISMDHPTLVRGTFILGVILGFLASLVALTLLGPAFVKITFFFSGVLTITGWTVFLLFKDALVPVPGFVLVFIGGVLALGSTFWSGRWLSGRGTGPGGMVNPGASSQDRPSPVTRL